MNAAEIDFIEKEYTGQRTPEYYQRRLENLGFTQLETVIDAACGIGQWASVLGTLNNRVHAFDFDARRIELARIMHGQAENITFDQAAMESSRLPDTCANAIFCYGAFMFSDMDRSLAEFWRLLKPGGKVYLNYNDWGWQIHLALNLGLRQGRIKPIKWSLRAILRHLADKHSQCVVTPASFRRMLANQPWREIASGPEGSLNPTQRHAGVPPGYPPHTLGLRNISESLIEKPT